VAPTFHPTRLQTRRHTSLVQVGPLEGDVRLLTNATGGSRGIAFCDYVDVASARYAIEVLSGTKLAGREIRINAASAGTQSSRGRRQAHSFVAPVPLPTPVSDEPGRRLEQTRSDERRGSYDERRGSYDERRGSYDERRGSYDERYASLLRYESRYESRSEFRGAPLRSSRSRSPGLERASDRYGESEHRRYGEYESRYRRQQSSSRDHGQRVGREQQWVPGYSRF